MCAALSPSLTLTVRAASATRTLTSAATNVTNVTNVTIGRGADCTVVLADPRKTISRLQARIDWRDGRWMLTDTGSNPTLVNGRIVDASREAVLRDGDTVRIGDYLIEVGIGAGGTSGMGSDMPTVARLPGRRRE